MLSPAAVPDAVAARLQEFLRRMRAESTEYGPDAVAMVDAAADTLVGGKRLRARFCHAGWAAVAATTDPDASEDVALWDLCAALEIFQSAALVHDDVIDNSDTRRGRPASHRALEASHRESGWSGDAERFGRSAAILLGDLLVAWSDDLLESALAAHPHAARVRAEYARMRRDVTVGQFLDIAEESAWSVADDAAHAERALRVASLKSARYSIVQPLVLGAALAGADDDQLDALRRFGHPVGMAFQLRDDVLGVFGDAATTGKPAGDDLREGKRTVLVAFTRERLTADERRALDALLGDPLLDESRVASVRSTMEETGALSRLEELISSYADEAENALSGARLDTTAITGLRDLARAATVRTA